MESHAKLPTILRFLERVSLNPGPPRSTSVIDPNDAQDERFANPVELSGNVFSTLGGDVFEEVCDHVKGLIAANRWQPRVETLPPYHSPLPEFSKEPR